MSCASSNVMQEMGISSRDRTPVLCSSVSPNRSMSPLAASVVNVGYRTVDKDRMNTLTTMVVRLLA